MLVKLLGQNFLHHHICALRLTPMGWWNWPSTISFYARRAQKHKKTVKSSVFTCFWDLLEQKLRVNMLVKLTPARCFKNSLTEDSFVGLSMHSTDFAFFGTNRDTERLKTEVQCCPRFWHLEDVPMIKANRKGISSFSSFIWSGTWKDYIVIYKHYGSWQFERHRR